MYPDAFAMFSAIEPAGSDDADGIGEGVAVARGVDVGAALLAAVGVGLAFPAAFAVGELVAVADGTPLPLAPVDGVPPPPLQASSANVSNNSTRFIAPHLPENDAATYEGADLWKIL